jgi:lycopene beta-cyclase
MNPSLLHASFESSVAAEEYDYIIAGAGCAGLSLIMRMIANGQFAEKKILLVDKEPKQKNDRTWCFWDKGANFFEPVLYKKWEKVSVHRDNFSKVFDINPYQYKMIRGIDFYQYCLSVIERQSNITIRYGVVENLESVAGGAIMRFNNELVKGRFIFNSISFQPLPFKTKDYFLLQHFKGWVIETVLPAFDDTVALLMDFNVDQQYGTAFVYIMPFSGNKALIEYTFFSAQVLSDEVYDTGLQKYLHQLLAGNPYTITEKESGVIPMTNYLFPAQQGNIINMGTAGGQTKASSGYTFQFIQKRTAAIVESMINKGHPFTKKGITPRRFQFYDSVLLHLLANRQMGGDIIFSRLFQKCPAPLIFKFLDNETSLIEDLTVIKTLPVLPFFKAAIAELFK